MFLTRAARICLLTMTLWTIFSFWACRSSRPVAPVTVPMGFDWQGHRGCRGLRPENTVPAFVQALQYPEIVTLELDLAVSKDGQLIVSHEPWFNASICHLPGGDTMSKAEGERLLIYGKTMGEIRAYDCGSWGNPRFPEQVKTPAYKPALREVVEAVRAADRKRLIRWNIEIKSQPDWDGVRTPPIEQFAALVVAEVRALGIAEYCTIQSFDVRPLQILHRTDPDLRLALLIENIWGVKKNLKKLGFTPHIYSPYYMTVSESMVKKCHAKGMKIIPWTVNDVPAMKKMISMGVDGIITDYPDRIGAAKFGI